MSEDQNEAWTYFFTLFVEDRVRKDSTFICIQYKLVEMKEAVRKEKKERYG